MVVDPDFWRGKRVFLTGHTGFKGAWLSLWLQRLGADVFGYSLPPPTEISLYDLAAVADGLTSETFADIRDVDATKAALRRAQPDIVIHMAAQAIVLNSYQDPIETFSTNVVGTVTLLEAIRSLETIRSIVIVTSDKCYQNHDWAWGYRETDPLGGHDPYSASKAAAEIAVASMRSSYFTAATQAGVASARAGNVIGGGDWAKYRIVPDIMRALLAKRPCVIRNPASVRPWQHVLEPLSGYLCLAQALWRDGQAYAGPWNFGPHEANARPVSWIADRLGELWSGSLPWERADGPAPHENACLKLDISKARAHLGWEPTWSLETTLRTIADWYQVFQAGGSVRGCVAAQIETFSTPRASR